MNYTELTARLQELTEDNYSAEQLALFTRKAEQFIYQTAQPPALRRNQRGAVTVDNSYLTLPSDYLYMHSLAVIDGDGRYHYLLQKDSNFIRAAYPVPTATGLPKHYAQFDEDSLLLGPTPDSGYSVEIHYGYEPESISSAGTSWLGDNYDSVLLSSMLVEAAIYNKFDQDMQALYKTKRDEELVLFKSLCDGKLRQDTYRTLQNRINVV